MLFGRQKAKNIFPLGGLNNLQTPSCFLRYVYVSSSVNLGVSCGTNVDFFSVLTSDHVFLQCY